jgi:hypothetical protein
MPGLATSLDSALAGRVRAVWDRIEASLRAAFEYGRDNAAPLVAVATAEAESLVASAGHRAAEVQQAILAKLNEYVTRLTDAALSRVRTELVLGSTTWRLNDVELTQTISLTGSLSTNITSLVTLTSVGELTVNARYSVSYLNGLGTRDGARLLRGEWMKERFRRAQDACKVLAWLYANLGIFVPGTVGSAIAGNSG